MTKLVTRRRPRAVASHRVPARVAPAGHGREVGWAEPHLPLSFAPYRLQAADRWWKEEGAKRPV